MSHFTIALTSLFISDPCALKSIERFRGVNYEWHRGEFPNRKFA